MFRKYLMILAGFLLIVSLVQLTYGKDGSTTLKDGVFTIQADGADVWLNSDSFRYVYTEVSGDAEIIIRAVSLENTNEWAKIGAMFRQSADSRSSHAFLLARAADGNQSFQYRSTTGAFAEEVASFSKLKTIFPVWIRIQRMGNNFVGSVSSDGKRWDHVGTITIQMEDPALVGISVTSHQFNVLTTGVVDNVTINGKAPVELKSINISEEITDLYQTAMAKIWTREEIDRAIADLKKTVETDASIIPDIPISGAGLNPPVAHYFLGAGYVNEGLWDKAIEHFRKSETVMPGFLSGVYSTEWWFEPLVDFNKRLRDGLEKLVAEKSDVAIINNHLGAVYSRLKEYDKAIAQFERSIEIAPNDSTAYMLLTHTYNRKQEQINDKVYDSLGLVRERFWSVIGPFDNADNTGFDKVYPPENEIKLQEKYEGKEKGNLIQWQMNVSDEVNDRYLDLRNVLYPSQYTTAYALCYIQSPDDREAQIRIGADDQAKMWLNDSEVPVPDTGWWGAVVDESIVPVRLREGDNKVLLKITQGVGGWGLYFRVTDMSGARLNDIKYVSPNDVLGNE